MNRIILLVLTLAFGVGGSACCNRAEKSKPGRPGAAATTTATTFPPDKRFLPIPAEERTLRVTARGGFSMSTTTPASSLSEDHCETVDGGYRFFGINNHGGVGGWAVAGVPGAGEFPLTGENGKVIVDVEMNASNETVGAHKVLSEGILRVELLSLSGGKARLRATAIGKAKTDSGKSVDVQVAFNVTTNAPQP